MIRINFKLVREGYNLCDTTYGDYSSLREAAAEISKDVEELSKADNGYFSKFNTKMNDSCDDYMFGWECEWDDLDSIIYANGFWISKVIKADNAYIEKENYVEWNIISTTAGSIEEKKRFLYME